MPLDVHPGAGYVEIRYSAQPGGMGGGTESVRATDPDQLRAMAEREERAAIRNDDRRRAVRALRWRQAADIWERQQAEAAQAKKAGTTAKRASTQRKKDEFTAGYGEGKERAAARRRLGWEE